MYEVLLFKTAFTLAFFSFMRISELVGQENLDNVNRSGLQVADIHLGSVLTIHIRASKTDQQGKGAKVQL